MKTTISMISLFTLRLALLAQSQPARIAANIPFDFVIGDQAMRAGRYTLERMNQDPALILVRSEDGEQAAFALTLPLNSRDAPGAQLRLIFHQYGATYFLSRIWTDMGGRELLESRKERELTEMRIALVTVLAEK